MKSFGMMNEFKWFWFEYKHLKTNDKNLPWDQDYFPTTKQEVVLEVEMTRRMNYLIFLKDPEE